MITFSLQENSLRTAGNRDLESLFGEGLAGSFPCYYRIGDGLFGESAARGDGEGSYYAVRRSLGGVGRRTKMWKDIRGYVGMACGLETLKAQGQTGWLSIPHFPWAVGERG